jgi:hypothetical protein
VLRKVASVAVVTVAAGLAVAGCAPIKMGAAAIVGDNSVSIAQLDTEAGKLAVAVKKYPSSQGGLTQQQVTQATLTWLIRFQIAEQVASQNHITVTPAQSTTALNQLVAEQAESAEQSGEPASAITLESIMVGAGVPPNLTNELGRYLVIGNTYETNANGGTVPSTQAEQTAAGDKYNHANCVAAKSLNIRVNPQFGRMSYSQLNVIDSANTVSLPSGTIPSNEPGGLSPAC